MCGEGGKPEVQRAVADDKVGIGALFSTILPTFTTILPSWWGIYGWFFGVIIAGALYYIIKGGAASR